MNTKLNTINLFITIISFIAYYSTFFPTVFTDFFNENGISLWYFPGAILFTVAIVLTIIGIIRSTKWLNAILLILNLLFLLHFTSIFLLV